MSPQRKTATRSSGRRRRLWRAGVALALVTLGGCNSRGAGSLGPCTVTHYVMEDRGGLPDRIDLLLMVDNHNSMSEEQASLAAQLPHLVDTLASGQLLARDGTVVQSFPAVLDLHVGVVDGDLGSGGFSVPTCSEPYFGDDGILRTRGNTTLAGCSGSYPSFLEFRRGPDDPAAFAADVTCVASLGTSGCGFQQPLDGILKALTPSTSSSTFAQGTRGHGDVENSGFVRDRSLLGVLLLSDRDDCSASDTDLFNESSARYSGDWNLRCFRYPEALYPTSRYVDGLLALRAGNPELLVFAPIVGVPADLIPTPAVDPDFVDVDAILADPRMQQVPDPSMPSRLMPSCDLPGRGLAFPPRRIAEVARDLYAVGPQVVLGSICQADLRGPIDDFLLRLIGEMVITCAPRAIPRVIDGGVDCLMSEVLPAEGLITHCAQLADRGRTLVSTRLDYDGVTREVCGIRQLPTPSDASAPPAGEGWYYDDFSSTTDRLCGDRDPSNGAQGQRLVFTPGAASPPGALVGFSCIRRILGHASDVIGPGTPCGPPWGIYCADSARPDLYCDERSRACVVGCETDGDCRDSGLGGGRCVDDLDMSCGGAAGSRCHCINPVCDSSP